jgi:hypothetical protein
MDLKDRYDESLEKKDFKECNEVLKEFSREHFTFINQIFGDRTIRAYIGEAYPESAQKYKFRVVKIGRLDHHTLTERRVVVDKPREGKRYTTPQERIEEFEICSYKNGDQNWDVDDNDMLCQSYSLLAFFEIHISTDKKEKQMQMIQMYRDKILQNKKFITRLEETIDNPKNLGLWKDFRISEKTNLKMVQSEILEGIRNSLDDWESFGYHYFIGDGTCPGTPKPKIEPRVTRSNVRARNEDDTHVPSSQRPRRGGKKSKSKSKSRSKSKSKSKNSKSKSKK